MNYIFKNIDYNQEINGLIEKLYFFKNNNSNYYVNEQAVLKDIFNIFNSENEYKYFHIDEDSLFRLHKLVIDINKKEIGGKIKSKEIYLIKYDHGIKSLRDITVSFDKAENELISLCNSYNQTLENKEVNPIIGIILFIIYFVHIHPFEDGNGRVSRMLLCLALYKEGIYTDGYSNIEQIISGSKDKYYESLHESLQTINNVFNPSAFIQYILGVIASNCDEIVSNTNIAFTLIKTVVKDEDTASLSYVKSKLPFLNEGIITFCLNKLYK